MPRTKISKSSKRNREAAQREEKIREFDYSVDQFNNTLDAIGQACVKDIESEVTQMVRRISKKLLQMSMGSFLQLNLSKFTDWTAPLIQAPSAQSVVSLGNNNLSSSQSIYNISTLRSAKTSNDEGYLTEDSTTGGSSAGSLAALTGVSQLQLQQQQRGRTPGPFSSAKAGRPGRPRRSKSFCADFVPGSAQKPTQIVSITTDHSSRSKLRTPQASRIKAISADRNMLRKSAVSPSSPASAFMRWPKPGEMVLSMCGSPVVAQVLPERFANVNIPVRNGVLSLRPKKLSELKPEIIESIDKDTLKQIKTLQASLNLIINTADKAGLY